MGRRHFDRKTCADSRVPSGITEEEFAASATESLQRNKDREVLIKAVEAAPYSARRSVN